MKPASVVSRVTCSYFTFCETPSECIYGGPRRCRTPARKHVRWEPCTGTRPKHCATDKRRRWERSREGARHRHPCTLLTALCLPATWGSHGSFSLCRCTSRNLASAALTFHFPSLSPTRPPKVLIQVKQLKRVQLLYTGVCKTL